jgi:uncharacterized membrane protein YoaK (UPF0700 family)
MRDLVLTMTRSVTRLRGDWLLPAVLSTTAGAVDVIGFLALGGLFTAHITGNVVVLAAHYVTGDFSEVGPLLSVPVFVAVLGVVTRWTPSIVQRRRTARRDNSHQRGSSGGRGEAKWAQGHTTP